MQKAIGLSSTADMIIMMAANVSNHIMKAANLSIHMIMASTLSVEYMIKHMVVSAKVLMPNYMMPTK
jgi:hypothetical protein